jgi:hypothetical protein
VTFTKFEGVTPQELTTRIEAWRKKREENPG